jgi:DNA-directed RNA polymerase subunit RPC12/RpoP
MKAVRKTVIRSDKKRCPKCGSNKWEFRGRLEEGTSQRYERLNFVFLYCAFGKYKCKKCGWEFVIEGREDRFFCAAENNECYRCGSSRWEKVCEDDEGGIWRCKHCNAHIMINKKTKTNSYE